MSKVSPRYTEDFKKSIVSLYHNGKTQRQLHEEYGVSPNTLARWIKAYSEVKLDDNTVITAKQVKALQKRNALLEEENLIFKKAIAIFMPHSNKD
ncbi:transposase [Fretibacterium sp. OH1220_COT-178]|uniref:transposase n=1 Tax=Fretibacterium sp. OH1220_COT-178 TaxID=2491047 RepID=UPI000F5EC52D|nr:transposase [Fretibacterium sp. OH1220_COT-178]RRD63512.1 transposase [Fretibacterium sp. OH1220_COT-178]